MIIDHRHGTLYICVTSDGQAALVRAARLCSPLARGDDDFGRLHAKAALAGADVGDRAAAGDGTAGDWWKTGTSSAREAGNQG